MNDLEQIKQKLDTLIYDKQRAQHEDDYLRRHAFSLIRMGWALMMLLIVGAIAVGIARAARPECPATAEKQR